MTQTDTPTTKCNYKEGNRIHCDGKGELVNHAGEYDWTAKPCPKCSKDTLASWEEEIKRICSYKIVDLGEIISVFEKQIAEAEKRGYDRAIQEIKRANEMTPAEALLWLYKKTND